MQKSAAKTFINLFTPIGDFKPLKNQVAYALLRFEYGNTKTDDAICKEIGIHPSNVSQWKNNPAYNIWYKAFFDQHFATQKLPKLYEALYGRACAQDTAAAKIIIERYDKQYKPESSQTLNFAGVRPQDEITQKAKDYIENRKKVDSQEKTAFHVAPESINTEQTILQQGVNSGDYETLEIIAAESELNIENQTDDNPQENRQETDGKDEQNND